MEFELYKSRENLDRDKNTNKAPTHDREYSDVYAYHQRVHRLLESVIYLFQDIFPKLNITDLIIKSPDELRLISLYREKINQQTKTITEKMISNIDLTKEEEIINTQTTTTTHQPAIALGLSEDKLEAKKRGLFKKH